MSTNARRWLGRPTASPKEAQFIVQASIIVILLVASVWLAYKPSMRILPFPIIAVAGWMVLRYPGLGPLAVLVALMSIQFTIGTSTQTSVHIGIVLLPVFLGLWVAKSLFRRWLALAPSPANLPVLGLAGAAVLSFIAGNVPWLAFAQTAPLRTQLGAVATFVVSAAAFLLVANEIPSLKWLKALVWTFLALGGLYIVGRAFPAAGGLLNVFPSSLSGSLFWIWIVAVAGGQLLFNKDLPVLWRGVCAAVIGLVFVVGLAPVARDWSSGWLPALLCLGLIVWLRWPRGALVVGIVVALVVVLNFNLVEGFLLGSDNEYSLLTRSAAWDIVLVIAGASPLLGVGPANYYWYTSQFPILGWYVNFNSHNQYLDLLAQTGLLGLGFFLWWALAAGRHAWQLRRRVTDGFSQAYVNAALAGLVASLAAGMLGDWLVPFVYNVSIAGMRASLLLWLFVGGMVALSRIGQTSASALAAEALPPT